MSKAAGLTKSQVVNWTTNVRKRNLKATVEKGKKPHHFLDFLFLANDRDEKGGMQQSRVSSSLRAMKKAPPRKKKGKKATPKRQSKIQKASNSSSTTVKNDHNPIVLQNATMFGHLNETLNPVTPISTCLHQFSPSTVTTSSFHAPMQGSFVPHFHPGAYTATRHFAPPRFDFQQNPFFDVQSGTQDTQLDCADIDLSPIPLCDINKINVPLTADIGAKEDIDQEVMKLFTQEELVSTPPRHEEEDDMLWGLELETDVNMKDVFGCSNTESISCIISMDESDHNRNKHISLTDADMVTLLNGDDVELDMLNMLKLDI